MFVNYYGVGCPMMSHAGLLFVNYGPIFYKRAYGLV